jgi:hypothetical protein
LQYLRACAVAVRVDPGSEIRANATNEAAVNCRINMMMPRFLTGAVEP